MAVLPRREPCYTRSMSYESTDLMPHQSRSEKHELSMRGISLSRGGHPLFSGISLSIIGGDVVWIGGDNGIGKSSLLRLMTGLSRADDGDISWTLKDSPCEAEELIGYQGHQDAFKPALCAAEALNFWADVMNRPQASMALLDIVGLGTRADVPCGQLSAGQKRRLSLARLMLSRKPVWIMDEPSAAMDAEGIELIHNIISAHLARGGSAVIASHNPPRISGIRARQLILKAAS